MRASGLELEAEELAGDDAIGDGDVHPGDAELDAAALHFEPEFIALFPAVIGFDGAPVVAFAAAERVGFVEVGFHEVLAVEVGGGEFTRCGILGRP